MFQRKTDEIFKELPDTFSTANDIFVVGYHNCGTAHDSTLCRVLQIYRNENLKLDKNKCHSGLYLFNSLVRLFPGKVCDQI